MTMTVSAKVSGKVEEGVGGSSDVRSQTVIQNSYASLRITDP